MDIWKAGTFSFPLKHIKKTHLDIEDFFKSIYPNTYPILFTSARAGIHSILTLFEVKRNDYIFTLPFSSHCVLNTISYLGTPTTDPQKARVFLIYHQLGFPLKMNVSKKFLIEDSVDSMVSSEASLFPNDGRFEVFSLPKIFGSKFGGIVLAKNKKDYHELLKVRDQRGLGFGHSFQKLFIEKSRNILHSWTNNEPLNRSVPFFIIPNLYQKISLFNFYLEQRKANLENLKRQGIKLNGLQKGRYPTAIPLDSFNGDNKNLLTRYFIRWQDGQFHFEKVKILPIHETF